MASIAIPILRRRLEVPSLLHWAILAAVIVLVLWPVSLVTLNSFQMARPGHPAVYSLEPWRIALSDPVLLSSVWNTVTLVAARLAISFPLAILIAWIIARTDIPRSNWLEFLFWIGFFIPPLPVTLGWILLLNPRDGLINQMLALLPFIDKGPFNVYSFWGIVWVHLGTTTLAVKVLLLTPALRNMDASLEEASRIAGASALGTLWRVVVPIMMPALSVTALLSIVHSLQAFEIELILGLPARLYVFSTLIYNLIRQEPPLLPPAMALSTLVLGLMVPLIVAQRWLVGRRRYTTVTGQYKGHKLALRAWRWPAFVFVFASAMFVTAVPILSLLLATFMRLFGWFNLPEPWTLDHWRRVFSDPIFIKSMMNTLWLGFGTAVISVIFFAVIAYILVRSRFRGRGALDFMSWLPVTIPGIILSLGLLWVFLGTLFLRPLYGTLFILIISCVVERMPMAVQIIKANFSQLGNDIEEAARVVGSSWLSAFWRVVLPLTAPTLILVGTMAFISAARSVSNVALLSTAATRPLALLQLDFMVENRYGSGAVVGVIVVLLTIGLALVGRSFGLRTGLRD